MPTAMKKSPSSSPLNGSMSSSSSWRYSLSASITPATNAPTVRVTLAAADAFVWHADGHWLEPVDEVNRVEIGLLRGIDRIRSGRYEQTNKDQLDSIGEVSSSSANPEETTVTSERRDLVRKALDSLSAEQREVIELAYYSGLSHSEIALRLGQPLGTVKTRTRLGMIKLRDMLRPVLEGQV